MKFVPSPCINICRADSKGVCYGCKRTREEIGNWMLYTNDQKQDVLDNLPKRTNAEEMQGFSF